MRVSGTLTVYIGRVFLFWISATMAALAAWFFFDLIIAAPKRWQRSRHLSPDAGTRSFKAAGDGQSYCPSRCYLTACWRFSA